MDTSELMIIEKVLETYIEQLKDNRDIQVLNRASESCREMASHYMTQKSDRCMYWLERSLEIEAYREMCGDTLKAESLDSLTKTYSLMGEWYKETGEYEKSLDAYKQALDSAKNLLQITNEADIMIVVGEVLRDTAKVLAEKDVVEHKSQIEEMLTEAEEYISTALEKLTAAPPLRNLANIYYTQMKFYCKLANTKNDPSHYQKAISSCKKVIEISRGFVENNPRNNDIQYFIVMHYELAQIYMKAYQRGLLVSLGATERVAFLEEAYAQCKQGLDLCEKTKSRFAKEHLLYLQNTFNKNEEIFAYLLPYFRSEKL